MERAEALGRTRYRVGLALRASRGHLGEASLPQTGAVGEDAQPKADSLALSLRVGDDYSLLPTANRRASQR